MPPAKPDFGALRAEFPLLDRVTYLNACSLGPLPRAGRRALESYADAWDRLGTPAWYSDWQPALDRLRARLGDLLAAPAGSVALAPSVSSALTTMASALGGLREGRNRVLIGALDFPTVGHQWLSRPEYDVEFIRSPDGVGIPVEAFAERIDERTALVATTHLYYKTGFIQDARAIAEAAHAAGAMCLIDGYQSVGCVPVDVEAMGCDVYVGGCLKWLSGGPGTAFLYCRPDLIERLRPQGTGWFGTREPFSFTLERLDFADDARRFENGTWPVPAHYAALAALELILDQVGVEAIWLRLRELTGQVIRRCADAGLPVLTPAEPELRSGVVTIASERGPEVEARLCAAGIVTDSRPGILRLSPHWCVTEAELDAALDVVVSELSPARATSSAEQAGPHT